MKRVVAELRIQADFDVIFAAAMTVQDLFDLPTEVALHFEDDATDSSVRVVRFVGQDLFGIREHAARTFSTAHRSQNRNAGEQSTLGNHQPIGCFRWSGSARVVNLAEDDEQVFSVSRVGIPGKLSGNDARTKLQRSDIERGRAFRDRACRVS